VKGRETLTVCSFTVNMPMVPVPMPVAPHVYDHFRGLVKRVGHHAARATIAEFIVNKQKSDFYKAPEQWLWLKERLTNYVKRVATFREEERKAHKSEYTMPIPSGMRRHLKKLVKVGGGTMKAESYVIDYITKFHIEDPYKTDSQWEWLRLTLFKYIKEVEIKVAEDKCAKRIRCNTV